MTMRKIMCGTIAVMSLAFGLSAPPASAAQWNNLSGTVYSGGRWYRSATFRHVTTSNDTIKLDLAQIPSDNINWYVNDGYTGAKFGVEVSIFQNYNTKTLATGVPNGKVFQNNYAQEAPCNYQCGNYNFYGQEYY